MSAGEPTTGGPAVPDWWLTSEGIVDVALGQQVSAWQLAHDGQLPTEEELVAAMRDSLASHVPAPSEASLERMVAWTRRRIAVGRFRTFTAEELEQATELLCDDRITFVVRGKETTR